MVKRTNIVSLTQLQVTAPELPQTRIPQHNRCAMGVVTAGTRLEESACSITHPGSFISLNIEAAILLPSHKTNKRQRVREKESERGI